MRTACVARVAARCSECTPRDGTHASGPNVHLHAVMHTLGAAPDDTRATQRAQQYCDRCTLIMTQVHDPSDSTCTAPATSADFLVPAVCWV